MFFTSLSFKLAFSSCNSWNSCCVSEIIAYCIESIFFLPSGLIPVKIGIFILPTTKKKTLLCSFPGDYIKYFLLCYFFCWACRLTHFNFAFTLPLTLALVFALVPVLVLLLFLLRVCSCSCFVLSLSLAFSAALTLVWLLCLWLSCYL